MGMVRDYQTKFECLENQVEGWPEKALVCSFVGGHKDEIAAEVNMFKPTNISSATGFARIQEEKLQHIRQMERPPSLLQIGDAGLQVGPRGAASRTYRAVSYTAYSTAHLA